MKIAILGIGAIGSYVAAMFAKNTQYELHLLAKSNFSALKNKGIFVDDISENITWQANRFAVCQSINEMPQCDVVILTTKVNQNKNILSGLAKICHAETKIISLQNGLNFETEIYTSLPHHAIYSGTCWIKVSRLAQSNEIRHDFGKGIKLGRYCFEQLIVPIDSMDFIIQNLFESAQLQCELVENIKSVQLTKLALNVPFFLLMASEGKTVGEILSDYATDKKRQQLQQEIMAFADNFGSPVDALYIDQIVENLRKMPVTKPASRKALIESMKTELPTHVEPLLALMKVGDYFMPIFEKLYHKI